MEMFSFISCSMHYSAARVILICIFSVYDMLLMFLVVIATARVVCGSCAQVLHSSISGISVPRGRRHGEIAKDVFYQYES